MTGVERAQRERLAYDEGNVWETNDRWHRRFPHVFDCPNTRRSESMFRNLVAERVAGNRVLEVGCGFGDIAEELLKLNPSSYLGIDVSVEAVARAQRLQRSEVRFKVHDVHQPLEGKFDLIFGQSVLHHIDFRSVLTELYEKQLAPGGVMAFVEPLQGGLMLRAYWRFAQNAHTPDEKPLTSADIGWMRQSFGGFSCYPFNYFSLSAGVVSSRLFRDSANPLMKAADALDRRLASSSAFASLFRRAVLLIQKPVE